MAEKISFTLNHAPVTVEVDPEMMTLDVIREVLNLTGTKHGCDNSTCGTCTILVNGKATKSCNLPVKKIAGAVVLTIEGLAKGTGFASSPGSHLGIRCDPVRFLHPGHRDGTGWAVEGETGSKRGGNGNRFEQAPLPLHRL